MKINFIHGSSPLPELIVIIKLPFSVMEAQEARRWQLFRRRQGMNVIIFCLAFQKQPEKK